ncbi:hypothetical protein [Leptothrix discophora]|uniref:Lipoprotein n=1 Tax=Leptothrix discophora TaxID=89 RepID=A0ABT9G0N4_LEPDI|nr:hypothetical protein [Leptothrix discophora]MDP4300008.1 hypothetical protein [Leptothrix discophora]
MPARRSLALMLTLAWLATGLQAAPAELTLPSCVAGSPPIQLPVSTEQALLTPADRQHFQTAAEQRYPLYQRGGMVPAQVLLLKREGRWVYVTLWRHGHRGTCVAALFAAERFDFTPAWLAKYRPAPLDALD